MFLTLTDQGVSSAGNLLLNFLLTKWLTGEAFGLFVLAFSVFQLLTGIHNAVLLEPISVLGVDIKAHGLPVYISQILYIHVLLTVATSVVGLAVAATVPLGDLGKPVSYMLLSLPFLLFPWMLRRIGYLLQAPGVAAVVSVAYAVSLIGLLVAQRQWATVSESSVFFTISLASLISGGIGYMALPIRPQFAMNREELIATVATLGKHWGLGKWVALQTVFTIGTTYAPLVFAAMSMDAAASGTLRILALILQPVQQVFASVGGYLLLPTLAKDHSLGHGVRARRRVELATYSFTAVATGYTAVLLVFRNPLEGILFNPGALDGSWLIPFYGLIFMVTALGVAWGIALRGARKVLYYPLSSGIPGVVGLVTAPILTFRWGVTGGVASIMIVAITLTILNGVLYLRWVRW